MSVNSSLTFDRFFKERLRTSLEEVSSCGPSDFLAYVLAHSLISFSRMSSFLSITSSASAVYGASFSRRNAFS